MARCEILEEEVHWKHRSGTFIVVASSFLFIYERSKTALGPFSLVVVYDFPALSIYSVFFNENGTINPWTLWSVNINNPDCLLRKRFGGAHRISVTAAARRHEKEKEAIYNGRAPAPRAGTLPDVWFLYDDSEQRFVFFWFVRPRGINLTWSTVQLAVRLSHSRIHMFPINSRQRLCLYLRYFRPFLWQLMSATSFQFGCRSSVLLFLYGRRVRNGKINSCDDC